MPWIQFATVHTARTQNLLRAEAQFISTTRMGGRGGSHSLCQRSLGLVPELSVCPPVGHVGAERVPALLPEHLLYQLGAGHVHHHQRAVRRLPQGAVDLAVLDL